MIAGRKECELLTVQNGFVEEEACRLTTPKGGEAEEAQKPRQRSRGEESPALGVRQDARRGMARTSFRGGALCGVLQCILRDSARGHTAGACSRHVSEGPARP
jgi:hypothetical protein